MADASMPARDLIAALKAENARLVALLDAWVFFAAAVAARDARRLGTALISHACNHTRQLQLASYRTTQVVLEYGQSERSP